MGTIRVATSQYEVGNDIQANLAKLLEVIDRAADGGAQLAVAPEFCSHAQVWPTQEDCWQDALDLDGAFVTAVRDKARERGIHVVFNAPVRADPPWTYGTNIFISPAGEIIGTTGKQVLIMTEHKFLKPSPQAAQLFETELGRVGMYSCMDGVIPETARALALRGAQLLVNTLSSRSRDESGMHIPVRAAENHVWVVAANKSGPIVPDDPSEPGVPEHFNTCPGETPIVDPDGRIVAICKAYEEDLIFADIEVEAADDKSWPDGDLFADRRPDCYEVLVSQRRPRADEPGPPEFLAAAVQARSNRTPIVDFRRAIDLARVAVRNGSKLVVLPELQPFRLGAIATDPQAAATEAEQMLDQALSFCAEVGCYLALSLPLRVGSAVRHRGLLISPRGSSIGTYDQVHLTTSYRAWAQAGDGFQVWNTPLGRIGMMLGYDGFFPESASVLARLGADILVHPTMWRQEWEFRYGLIERAAENHVSLISSARLDSPVQQGSIIVRAFESKPVYGGELNPVRPVQAPYGRETYVAAPITPGFSRDKEIRSQTDVLANRRPELYGLLVGAPTA